MQNTLRHHYNFDPTHGYTLERLLSVSAPDEPEDFQAFWRERFDAAARLAPRSNLRPSGTIKNGWRVFGWDYESTGGTRIRGWVLEPVERQPTHALIIGHGYDGRTGPDFDLPFADAILAFPCARGLGCSRHPDISPDARWHVIHDIHRRDAYVIGGCVEDTWLAVSALLHHYPGLAGHVGLLGLSFGGGVAALALPWDPRIARAHLSLPTFGNQPLRLQLSSVGSAASVQQYSKRCPALTEVLKYYDAATAARHIRIPVHCACALFDPSVAPAGQFAIYNALAGPKELFVLQAGHHPYPGQAAEETRLRQDLYNFFRDIAMEA